MVDFSRFIQLSMGVKISVVTKGAGCSDPVTFIWSPQCILNLKSPSIHPWKGILFSLGGTLIVIIESKGIIRGLNDKETDPNGVIQIALTSVCTMLPPADML
jgi:hypothetical protein